MRYEQLTLRPSAVLKRENTQAWGDHTLWRRMFELPVPSMPSMSMVGSSSDSPDCRLAAGCGTWSSGATAVGPSRRRPTAPPALPTSVGLRAGSHLSVGGGQAAGDTQSVDESSTCIVVGCSHLTFTNRTSVYIPNCPRLRLNCPNLTRHNHEHRVGEQAVDGGV